MPGPSYPNYTQLDADQVLQRSFDESADRLRVDASVTATIAGPFDVSIEADADNIAIRNSTNSNELLINADGSINTNITGDVTVELNAADGDNVAISDGTDTLAVNADGSINTISTYSASLVEQNYYGEASSVASGVETTVVTYTVPVGLSSYIHYVEASGEPNKVQLIGKSPSTGLPVNLSVDTNGNLIVSATSLSTSDFTFGTIASSSTTQKAVRKTTYNEQTTNARRSIVSSSALDTSAGTGARSVTITYFDNAGNGPYSETVTMNGVLAVNTTNTNICFIEKMEVATVGSGGTNAGTITLKTSTGGLGTDIGSITIGDNQTLWAHHYIAVDKVCSITGLSVGHNGTTTSSGGTFVIKKKNIGDTSPEIQVSDFFRLYGQSSTLTKQYNSSVRITGPARFIMYVTPESGSSFTYQGNVEFYES